MTESPSHPGRDADVAPEAGAEPSPVLRVEGLRVSVGPRRVPQRIVDGISFTVAAGETLCLVGESGCGKSLAALSLMGLSEFSGAQVEADRLELSGRDLTALDQEARGRLRGGEMAMIFQEPMTSLNPSWRIGRQIEEAILAHQDVGRAEARAQALRLLARVRIADPEARMEDHPHQLSGGQRQRVMIAMALANRPRLLIADEPTTALDVGAQRAILGLMQEIREEVGAAVVLITHDLGVVAQVADHVAVMYAGRVAERASVDELFSDPRHPYTLGLFASIPRSGPREAPLIPIPGAVPAFDAMPAGCRFANRCPFADARCLAERPPLVAVSPTHSAECWKLDEASA